MAGHEAGRPLGIPTRSPHDVVRRHPGCLLRPCRRAWRRMLRQRLEAVAPPFDEARLVAVLDDQRTDHRQCHRRIGSRPWPQPQIGDLHRGVRNGSMTMIRAPRCFARFNAIHWMGPPPPDCAQRPGHRRYCRYPRRPPMPRPVILSATARQPPHRSWFTIQFGDPIERISSAIISPRLKNAPLVAPAIARGPCWRRTAANRSAISSSAASHVTGFERAAATRADPPQRRLSGAFLIGPLAHRPRALDAERAL